MSKFPPGTPRPEKIRAAVQELAEVALLQITVSDLENALFKSTKLPPTVAELRDAMTMLHRASVYLAVPDPSREPESTEEISES